MAKYSVSFPIIVVEAPNEWAARRQYWYQVENWWGFEDVTAVEVILDCVVGDDGHEIEDQEE